MKKVVLAGLAALTVAGSAAAYAHHPRWQHHHHVRMSPEDRAAMADARIAAVKAGLKLTPDQEKLWPPLETAVRDFTKLRADRANVRMQARQAAGARETRPDPVTRLRNRAERMADTSAALKKIADAADPLYKTLDDGQKRRLAVLTRMEGGFFGGGRHWHHHHGDHGFRRDRGPDHERPQIAPGEDSGRL